MIVNDGLAAWLGSPRARQATAAAMGDLSARIASIPALATLGSKLAGAAEAGADAVLALAGAMMEDDEAIGAAIAASIAAAARDPMCRPPLRASRNELQDGLLLFSNSLLVVQLAVMSASALAIKRGSDQEAPPIAFTGQRTLFRFLKGGNALLSIWEAPPIEAGFTAQAGARCRLRERRRLADGDSIAFDGRRESFVVERAESDIVYIFASTSLEASPVATEYDARSRQLIATSSTDEAGSRIQMMLALLRTMGRHDAAPLFAEQLQASHFHTRWQAMRELLALDAELALPHLKRMAGSDSHPDVRAAAAETLSAFFPEACLPCPA